MLTPAFGDRRSESVAATPHETPHAAESGLARALPPSPKSNQPRVPRIALFPMEAPDRGNEDGVMPNEQRWEADHA
jgi:hypothetical protein